MSDHFNTGVIIYNNLGLITSANGYVGKLIQRDPFEIVGRPLSSVFRDEDSSLIHKTGRKISVFTETDPLTLQKENLSILILWNEQVEIRNDSTYQLITENTTDLIRLMNADGIIQYASPSHRHLLGYSPESLIGQSSFQYVHPDDSEIVYTQFADMKKFKTPSQMTFRFQHAMGHWVNVESKAMPITDDDGEIKDIVAVIRDITDQVTTMRKIEESEQRYRSLFDRNPDMVFALDMEFCYVSLNPSLVKASKYEIKELMNRPFSTLVSPTELKKTVTNLIQARKGIPQTYESIFIDKYGKRIEVNIINIPILIEGKVVGLYGIAKDMTQQRQAERMIHRLAYYDSLTGLPNRYHFQSHLTNVIAKAKASSQKFALMYFDMDNFKNINDSLGHSSGDMLLKQLGQRLKEVLPNKGIFISRLSGDEFTILVESYEHVKEIYHLAELIIQSFQKPFQLEHQEVIITSSIGITLFPEHGEEEDTLVKNADVAMYMAKEKGKNHYTFFAPDQGQKPIKQLQMEMNLRKAIEQEEFEMVYQPIVEAQTGTLHAFEALIRWNHPEIGMISPAEFIPLAEMTGLINKLGEWIIHDVCRQSKEWENKGYPYFPVSINISGRQFERKDMYKLIRNALDTHRLDSKRITIEITETAAMQHKDKVIHTLKVLKKLGCRVAIDDFGSGYSSLTYLQTFPTDYLKIDRGFVKEILASPKQAAIISTIIQLGHILGLKVVAEGVENQEEWDMLKEYNCDFIQGYLTGRPLNVLSVEKEWLDGLEKNN